MNHGDPEGIPGSTSGPLDFAETGPYVFRSLLDNVPLAADGDRDDIEINCVEFLGTYIAMYYTVCAPLGSPFLIRTSADFPQSRISMLEPLPPKSSTSFRYLLTPTIHQEGRHTFWPRDSNPPSIIRLHRPDLESNRSCSFPQFLRRAYYVTGRSHSTHFQN